MKVCFKCEERKPLRAFYKHKAMSDGHLNKCIECTKADVKKHRAENLEKVREYDRSRGNEKHRVEARQEYRKTQHGRERLREGQRRWSRRNAEKRRAHNATRKALLSGKITKGECEVCHAEENIEAHHADYSKPLEVQWLCNRCHADLHKEMRERERKAT